MTREYFVKRKWSAYEQVDIFSPRKKEHKVRCMVLAIDFENETMQVEPFDKNLYEDKSFWCSIDRIEIPKFKIEK